LYYRGAAGATSAADARGNHPAAAGSGVTFGVPGSECADLGAQCQLGRAAQLTGDAATSYLATLSSGLRYRECGSEVRRVIQNLRDRLSDCLTRSGLGVVGEGSPAAVDALYQYADSEARPELALRFLLRLLVASNCTIGLTEYEDLREVGAAVGYGIYLVSTVEFLVD